MSFAASSFGTAYYRFAGPPDQAVIVFCNSLGTDARIWDGVLGELEDYRVLTYDKRGHGLSSVPQGPYSIADLAGDLLEVVDLLGVDRFTLVGVSVGGLLAQRFALDHPERLAALVLCDTAPQTGDAATWNGRIEAVRAGGMEAVADVVLALWFPDSVRADREAEIEGWRNLLLRSPVEGYAATCAALRDTDLTGEVAGIAVPTLVVVGAEDRSTPVAVVRSTAERIPGARFEIIEAAGHLPCVDQPHVLARLIRSHVEEHVHD
jgi:3-oxoadipate enol-lactonase